VIRVGALGLRGAGGIAMQLTRVPQWAAWNRERFKVACYYMSCHRRVGRLRARVPSAVRPACQAVPPAPPAAAGELRPTSSGPLGGSRRGPICLAVRSSFLLSTKGTQTTRAWPWSHGGNAPSMCWFGGFQGSICASLPAHHGVRGAASAKRSGSIHCWQTSPTHCVWNQRPLLQFACVVLFGEEPTRDVCGKVVLLARTPEAAIVDPKDTAE
jgi:hypothetical protein